MYLDFLFLSLYKNNFCLKSSRNFNNIFSKLYKSLKFNNYNLDDNYSKLFNFYNNSDLNHIV